MGNRVVFTYEVTEDDYGPVSVDADPGLIHMDGRNYIYTLDSSDEEAERKRIDAEHEGLPRRFFPREATLDARFSYRVDGLRKWNLIEGRQVLRGPAAPANLRAVPGNGMVQLHWDNLSDARVQAWLLWREDDPHWREISRDYNTHGYKVRGLTNGKLYRFRVRARYGDQWGVHSGQAGEIAGPVEARPQPWLKKLNQAPQLLEYGNYAGDMNLYQYKQWSDSGADLPNDSLIARMGNVFYDPDSDPLTYEMQCQDGTLNCLYWTIDPGPPLRRIGPALKIDPNNGNILTDSDTRTFLGQFGQPPRNGQFVLCVKASDPDGASASRCITFDQSPHWPHNG